MGWIIKLMIPFNFSRFTNQFALQWNSMNDNDREQCIAAVATGWLPTYSGGSGIDFSDVKMSLNIPWSWGNFFS